MRVVVVEDNLSLRKGIGYRLRDEGYGVDLLDDGESAAAFLVSEPCDVLVLDINLPGRSGLDLLREMRARGDQRAVILLTARGETQDRVTGLDSGADDYLVKPFEMDELVARIRALGRRKEKEARHAVDLGRITLELSPPRVIGEKGAIDVPRRELNLLVALAEARGAPLSKDYLLDFAYGVGSDTDEKVIEVNISRLRKRLKPYGVTIKVQRGIGYSLTRP